MSEEETRELFCKPSEERSLLCYALNKMDDFYTLCSQLEEKDFLYPDHRMIYIIMKSLTASKSIEKFDVSMITSEAKNNGVLDNIGGYEYIESISTMDLDKSNLPIYIKEVLEASTKHRLYKDLSGGIATLVDNAKSGKNSEALIGLVESKIMDLSTRAKSIDEARDLAVGLIDYIEERRNNPVEQSGISTGFPILDNQIDGLIPGTLHILSARKKMGKSTFLSNVAAHVAYRLNIPVLYVDTEMSFNEWRNRLIAMMSGVEERIIKHGGYTNEQYNKISMVTSIIKRGKLFHHRMPGYSVDKLSALYKKYKIKEDIGLAIFDYVKEPGSSNSDRKRQEWQILGDVATKLKDLSGTLNIPFLTAVQLNREGGVAGSDRISWFADIVMQWGYRKKEEVDAGGEESGQFKLIIKDTRRGGGTPEEGIGYKFRKKSLQIKEVAAPFQLIQYGDDRIEYGSDDNEKLK